LTAAAFGFAAAFVAAMAMGDRAVVESAAATKANWAVRIMRGDLQNNWARP
jgi:hypothetical protein